MERIGITLTYLRLYLQKIQVLDNRTPQQKTSIKSIGDVEYITFAFGHQKQVFCAKAHTPQLYEIV